MAKGRRGRKANGQFKRGHGGHKAHKHGGKARKRGKTPRPLWLLKHFEKKSKRNLHNLELRIDAIESTPFGRATAHKPGRKARKSATRKPRKTAASRSPKADKSKKVSKPKARAAKKRAHKTANPWNLKGVNVSHFGKVERSPWDLNAGWNISHSAGADAVFDKHVKKGRAKKK